MPLPDGPLPDDDARADRPVDETDPAGLPVGADLDINAAGQHCYDVTISHPSGASTRRPPPPSWRTRAPARPRRPATSCAGPSR